jgi:hypothetical protein
MRYPKKGSQHLLHERQGILRFIAYHANEFPVEKMHKALNMSSIGYCYWRKYRVGTWQQSQQKLEQ